ncbi:MAG: hypothetical protein IH946_04620, partial [Bacteroidetes bacterium]|nr:hypothetical protein [Bacteroidota bacterium]
PFSDPFKLEDIDSACRDNPLMTPSAIAAVNIAYWDLQGKLLGQPLYRLWGLNPSKSLISTFTIGIDEIDVIKQKVREAEIYPILKVKQGLDNDREIISAIRELTDKPIRVDANEGWTKEEALEKIEWLSGQNVEFVEQPLPADKLDESAWLKERSPLPIVADENCMTKEDIPKKVLVVFGPEHAPLEQRMVENAWQEARALKPDMLLFCAFQFDNEAAKDIDELTPAIAGMQLLKAQMNADMLTGDLRKKQSSNESFWLIGQSDIKVHKLDDNRIQVEVMGFDYYNPKTGNVESGSKNDIAMWMLDTDYDNRSLFPSQVFFPIAGDKDGWSKLTRNLKAEIDEEKIEAFRGTMSLTFKPGSTIAVKIIDARGIESLRVINI